MIFDYGFSIRGKSHMQQDKPCQDAHYIRRLDNGWYVAAAADGVGSRANAEEGAQLAVKTAVDFVCEYMPYDCNLISIKSMLRTAFNYALKTIIRHAEAEELPVENFDTTLSLAIYDGSRIIYAHSGDGAIIGLTTFGELVEITHRQKAEDGTSLIPLRAGYTAWEIDTYEEDLAGLIIVTDGMLDALSPYLLKINSSGASGSSGTEIPPGFPDRPGKSGLYVPLGLWLTDPAGIPENEEGRVILKERMEAFITADVEFDSDFFYERLQEIYEARIPEEAEAMIEELKQHNYPVALVQGSQDDKTVVGLLNTEALIDSQLPAYYKEPDWVALQDIWNRMAYPSMYEGKADEEGTVQKEDGPSFLKWMKKWTRLEPSDQADIDSEVKTDEGSDILQ